MHVYPIASIYPWPVTLSWEDEYMPTVRQKRGFEDAHDALEYAIYLGLSEFRID